MSNGKDLAMPLAIMTDKLTDDKDSWNIKWNDTNYILEQHRERNANDESTKHIEDYIASMRNKSVVAIDLGCGNGRHILPYKDRINGQFIGADFSITGLRKIRDIDHHTKLATADVANLPFCDTAFDFVLMVGVVYEIKDLNMHRNVFTEIHRILKPGGVCLFVCNSNLHMLERLYYYFPKWNPLVRKMLSKPPVHRENLAFWYYRLSARDVRGYANASGLNIDKKVYCNVRNGLRRTWDQVLVTEDSTYNDIRFKRNFFLQAIGTVLLSISKVFPNISARTAIYYLSK